MFKSLTRLASIILPGRRFGKTQDAIGASTELRNVWITGIITTAGPNCRVKLYNNSRPPTGGTPVGQLLATLVMGTALGTAENGQLNFNEAGMTQNNTLHVNGTPTWLRIEKSGGTHVVDMSIPEDAIFAGSVVNGVDVALNPSTITAPHA
jgi:hypothetical protein